MLNNDRRVRDKRPEVVRKQSGVSLEMGEESRRISVVVWIFGKRSDFSCKLVIGISDFIYKIASPITTFSRPHCGGDCYDSGLRPCHAFDDILPFEELSVQQ